MSIAGIISQARFDPPKQREDCYQSTHSTSKPPRLDAKSLRLLVLWWRMEITSFSTQQWMSQFVTVFSWFRSLWVEVKMFGWI